MKLGIFTSQFEAKHVENGISNNAYLTAKYMIEKGFDVHVFAPKFRGLKSREDHGKLKIERFDIKLVGGLGYFSTSALVQARKVKIDIAHSFHYGYFPASLGLRVAKEKNIPHMLTPTFHKPRMGVFRSMLFSMYNKTEGKKLLSKSMVLPYNNDEQRHLSEICKFDYKVVPSPIEEDVFYPGKKSSKPTILFVGAMLPWKGARIAFDICRQIEKETDARFKFIGSGPLESMKKEASKNFIFMKNLTPKQLAAEYRSADVFLYPTAYESFGRVAAESMMSGTPVVSTRTGAIPETVGPGGILVNYGQWDEMREITLDLIKTGQKRKKLSKAAVKHSRNFSAESVGKKIHDVYVEQMQKH